MFCYIPSYSREVFLCDIKEKGREKEIIWDALLLFWKTAHIPGLGRSKPALLGAMQTCTGGGWLLQIESLGEMPEKPPKPFPDRGITSTACPAQSTTHHSTFPQQPEIKAKPNSRRLGSKPGHERFSKGQGCLLQAH